MELKTELQHRMAYQPTGLLMREEGEEKKPKLSGVAIVTNAETILYEGSDWREIEIIDPSCLNDEFMKEQDIKLNLLHERATSFARNNKGAGTLVLTTGADGLSFECPIPDCDLGKRAKALIENGTYTGCSFEFWAKDYEVSERKAADGKKEYVIRHKAFEKIGAITIGMDPAYNQTSVGLREMVERECEEEKKKKCEEEAEAQKAKEEEEEKAKQEAECKKQKQCKEAAQRERDLFLMTMHNNQ